MNMETIYVTSDLHFFHRNILRFQPNRRFSSIDEMNEYIVKHINTTVKPGEVLYHLGDLSFANAVVTNRLLSRITCDVRLIFGNHDQNLVESIRGLPNFSIIGTEKRIKHQDSEGVFHEVYMHHFPWQVWNKSHHGSMHIHGHCHGSLDQRNAGRRADVGFDTTDITGKAESRIFNLTEVIDVLRKKEIVNSRKYGE